VKVRTRSVSKVQAKDLAVKTIKSSAGKSKSTKKSVKKGKLVQRTLRAVIPSTCEEVKEFKMIAEPVGRHNKKRLAGKKRFRSQATDA